MARVTSPSGHTRVVKNLGWFLRKARATPLKSVVMTHHGGGYVMEAIFDDNYVFVTPYASLTVFKNVMGRRPSMKGQDVAVVDGGHVHHITIGEK